MQGTISAQVHPVNCVERGIRQHTRVIDRRKSDTGKAGQGCYFAVKSNLSGDVGFPDFTATGGDCIDKVGLAAKTSDINQCLNVIDFLLGKFRRILVPQRKHRIQPIEQTNLILAVLPRLPDVVADKSLDLLADVIHILEHILRRFTLIPHLFKLHLHQAGNPGKPYQRSVVFGD